MNPLPPLPPHFWILVAACLSVTILIWWLVLGATRHARRRILRQRIEAAGEAPPNMSTPQVPAERSAIYSVPAFLFIGDAEADVAGLLRDARDAGDLHAMVAVDSPPGTVRDATHMHERGPWFRTLLALANKRERLPVNGLVICVAASTLLRGEPGLQALAARLRCLADEATEHLGLRLPVYLVVTRLEQLQGYEGFRAALPPEVLGQALGQRMPERPTARETADALFEESSAQTTQRLHALRMSLLRGPRTPASRQAIHAFIEQVNALQAGLGTIAAHLFDNNTATRPPLWRGVYLTGTGTFITDLFRRFLPADQPLAHALRHPRAARARLP
jgi:type VI secretion system protein ImpL